MKILVIQLARLGDILQTWPTLRSLKRKFPDAEVHLMIRPRFQAAVQLIDEVHAVWRWPTEEFFSDLLSSSTQDPLNACLDRVNLFVDTLADQKFTHILNLSFSPLSSYLAYDLAQQGAEVRGYTRTDDGHLAIPDDASAYFYAQVGPGRSNRFHLVELFASVAGAELTPEDQRLPSQTRASGFVEAESYGVIHVGASEGHKIYPAFKWKSVLRILEKESSLKWLLIGSQAEVELAQSILSDSTLQRTQSLVGKTSFGELFDLLRGAQVLVGGDSAPIHIASLVNCPTVNLSFGSVNFWETGPRADRARVIWADCPELLASDRVALEVMRFLRRDTAGPQTYDYQGGAQPEYVGLHHTPSSEFTWKLLRAIYLGQDWPYLEDIKVYQAFVHLREAVDLSVDQIEELKRNPQNRQALALLNQADLLIEKIGESNPAVMPLIRWFNTERIRIKPDALEEVTQRTLETYQNLILILNLYGTGASELNEGSPSEPMLDR